MWPLPFYSTTCRGFATNSDGKNIFRTGQIAGQTPPAMIGWRQLFQAAKKSGIMIQIDSICFVLRHFFHHLPPFCKGSSAKVSLRKHQDKESVLKNAAPRWKTLCIASDWCDMSYGVIRCHMVSDRVIHLIHSDAMIGLKQPLGPLYDGLGAGNILEGLQMLWSRVKRS